jgi:hypothetical protein
VSDERVDVLVLAADGTAASDELEQALRERADRNPAAFTLLVPATPEGVSRLADLEPDPERAERQARPALERLRQAGLEVEARIGDSEPVSAAEDALNFGDYQEVIVATTSRKVTKLARMDLARRIEATTSLPVSHVTASRADED